jgi:ketosteroid isomerase-like protein
VTRSPSDVFQEAFAAFVRGDVEVLVELSDPEVEVYVPDNPETQFARGARQALEVIGQWTAAFDDYALELREVVASGDRVLAVATQSGRAALSGVPLEEEIAYVVTVRNGLITSWGVYSVAEARAVFEEA